MTLRYYDKTLLNVKRKIAVISNFWKNNSQSWVSGPEKRTNQIKLFDFPPKNAFSKIEQTWFRKFLEAEGRSIQSIDRRHSEQVLISLWHLSEVHLLRVLSPDDNHSAVERRAVGRRQENLQTISRTSIFLLRASHSAKLRRRTAASQRRQEESQPPRRRSQFAQRRAPI